MPTNVPGVDQYLWSQAPVPHHTRARELLSRPEIRALVGRNPWTAAICVGLVTIQLSVGWVLRDAPAWAAVVAAWVVGALLVQGLWVMIHEAGHGTVFRGTAANAFVVILASLPMVVPSGMSFVRYHDRHHTFRGVYDEDGDLSDHWEARVVGGSAWRKAAWLLFYWAFMALRTVRLVRAGRAGNWDRWVWLNIVIGLVFNVWIWQVWGGVAMLYLFASLVFGIGLHPLGARWIQEHFVFREGQETYSYYGPANLVTFNVGYHVEHHDLPSVPWNRLPRLAALAPDMYAHLYAHRSWSGLLWRFLVDRNLTLYSRVARPG